MSVKEAIDPNNGKLVKSYSTGKRRRFNRCFSFMEISTDPGVKSLKHLDSKKFKSQIKKWATTVVAYARQVSERRGSSRHRGMADHRN